MGLNTNILEHSLPRRDMASGVTNASDKEHFAFDVVLADNPLPGVKLNKGNN